mgnify:CR=1 FL=1
MCSTLQLYFWSCTQSESTMWNLSNPFWDSMYSIHMVNSLMVHADTISPRLAHQPQIRHIHENRELESSTCKLEHVSKRQCKLDRIFNTISFSLVTMQIPSKRFVGWHVPCSYNFTKPNIDSSHIKCTLIGIWCNLLAFRRVHPKSSDLAFLPCWSSWWCLVKWVVLSTIGWYTTIICWNPNLLTLQSSWFD